MLGASKQSRSLWPIGALLGASALLALVLPLNAQRPRVSEHSPIEARGERYVSSRECKRCHAREYATWHDSYHRRMTQLATPESVIPSFSGVAFADPFEQGAPSFALGRSGADYHVDVLQPGAAAQRHAVSLVTGSHHMQIFWYETGHDRSLEQLPFVYLNADQRWVPRNAIFIEPPAPLQPAAEGRWNASCIACHTTRGQPRIDAKGAFDTRVAEMGVACEACHGPGETHVQRNRSPLARYRAHLTGAGDGSIVQPRKLDHARASYVCAQCHSTTMFDGPRSMRDWNEHGPRYRPGQDRPAAQWLLQPSRAGEDERIAAFVQHEASFVESQFWSDGVMRVSGREFNGMVDSPCYQRGELSCSSCHTMHQTHDDPRSREQWKAGQLSAGMDSDRVCLQCHAQYGTAHTQHAQASAGSRCVNCHMTYTSYGLLKALRSHRIDVPSVRATVEAGRPNACNLCHLDKSLRWTAQQLRARYGHADALPPDERADLPLAQWLGLRGDAAQRALIAWALGWEPARKSMPPGFAPPLLGALLDDPYAAVRYIASHALAAHGVSFEHTSYDFLTPPDQRALLFERMIEGLSAEERALFARLTAQRDDHPLRLLE